MSKASDSWVYVDKKLEDDPHGLRCATQGCRSVALTDPYMFLLCYHCLRAVHDVEVKKQNLAGFMPFDADTGELLPTLGQ